MEKMGFLGPRGTHSEEAAIWLESAATEKAELIPYDGIFELIRAVSQGTLDRCLVPVENSLEGSINVTLDTLARTETLAVNRELIWPVHNQLLAKCAAPDVKTIHSHPQPLSQCRKFLDEHFPWARQCGEASSARAAEIVAASRPEDGLAAIGTARAAEIYGLTVLSTEIQDNSENRTRFYEVRRRGDTVGATQGRALVICQIDGAKAGALLTVLQKFADYNVNLTRIESRPARTVLGAYIFFFDLELTDNIAAVREAVEAVRKNSIWLRYFGEFPVLSV